MGSDYVPDRFAFPLHTTTVSSGKGDPELCKARGKHYFVGPTRRRICLYCDGRPCVFCGGSGKAEEGSVMSCPLCQGSGVRLE